MRNFVMLQGLPASGKSEFVKENKLEEHTISSDEIRLLMMGLKKNPDGVLKINQEDGYIVWSTIIDLLESRFQLGLPTILDATNLRTRNVRSLMNKAKIYEYNVYILRFDVLLDDAIANDVKRPPYKVVGDEVIKNMYKSLQNFKMPKQAELIDVDRFNKIWRV